MSRCRPVRFAAARRVRTVYAWLTHTEAEGAKLPERVRGELLHTTVEAALAGRGLAPPGAHYLVAADTRSRAIVGYA